MRHSASWWWMGLVVALAVRLTWLANIQVPPAVEQLGQSLFSQDASSSAIAQPDDQRQESPREGSCGRDDAVSLPWAGRYLICPLVREVCRRTSTTGLRLNWYWVLGAWQALLQSLAVAGLTVVAWRLFGHRLLTSLMLLAASCYPPALLQLISVSDLPLIGCLFANWLALALATSSTGGVFAPACIGLLSGSLVIVRPGWALAIVLVTVWYLWRLRRVWQGWLASLILVLALANMVGTWCIRHWLQTGEPVPFAAGFWRGLAEGLPSSGNENGERPSESSHWRVLARKVVGTWMQHPRDCVQHRLQLWADVLVGEPVYEFGCPAIARSSQNHSQPARDQSKDARLRVGNAAEPTPGMQPSDTVTPSRPPTVAVKAIPAPRWAHPALAAGLLPIIRCLFWLAVALGWRWSFRLPWPHWPISASIGSVLLAYGFGSYDTLHWGVAAVEPVLLLYAVFALTAWTPGILRMASGE